MSSLRPYHTTKIYPYTEDPLDHFDLLLDSLLLLIFNRIDDVKTLGRCCVVSKRFHTLLPQVENVVVRVDCVISDDDATGASDKSRGSFSSLVRFIFGGIVKSRSVRIRWNRLLDRLWGVCF